MGLLQSSFNTASERVRGFVADGKSDYNWGEAIASSQATWVTQEKVKIQLRVRFLPSM